MRKAAKHKCLFIRERLSRVTYRDHYCFKMYFIENNRKIVGLYNNKRENLCYKKLVETTRPDKFE